MRKILSGLYHFSCSFIQILSLIFTGLLFVSGFLFTCYADNMETQKVLTVIDNPLLNILGIAIFLSAIFFCCRLIRNHTTGQKKVLLFLVWGWVLLLGALLILFGKTVPAADAWSVYSAADCFARGDTSVIHPTDSYLSYYTQQVGLMAFFELLIRLWHLLPVHLHAYHFIKCFYVLLTCVIIYYQYRLVHLLWSDDRADCVYLILAGANLPLIMYSSFVYGEIPSFAAISIGIYHLMLFLSDRDPAQTKLSFLDAAISLAAFTTAVLLRKNSLIFIIAVVAVLLLEWCRAGLRRFLLTGVLCAALSLGILPGIIKIYELRAHNYLSSGVPAISYFAMGMQESSRANGWYNGFNFYTYQESGMNTEITAKISREAIAERMDYFCSHPGYAVKFYFQKYLSQWADGTYASRQATLATFGGRPPLVQSLYEGTYSRGYIAYCNVFQNILYLGGFLFFLSLALNRQKASLYVYLGSICIFGGFLFHMIWEANARYIFPYSLLFLPYAAKGISDLNSTFFPGKSRQNNTDRKADATETPTTAM